MTLQSISQLLNWVKSEAFEPSSLIFEGNFNWELTIAGDMSKPLGKNSCRRFSVHQEGMNPSSRPDGQADRSFLTLFS